jgi:hypothetical protein
VNPLLELVRWPAALSVPGDVLVGARAAGVRPRPGLVASSCCLYWAGMALNDWADRSVDAVERPDRPIPSGRVRPAAALGLAAGLTAAGLGLAWAAGGPRSLAVAVPLAATVWAYDLGVRGPALMVAARGLDVLAGAGGRAAALPAAGTVSVHTAVVMGLSAAEATGGAPAARRARWGLAGTLGVAALAALPGAVPAAFPGAVPTALPGAVPGAVPAAVPAGGVRRVPRVDALAVGLLGAYAGAVGGAQLAAARDPRPATVRRAVGAGVLGVIPLQAALLAKAGGRGPALAVAALWPAARRLSRRVSAS